MRLDVLKLGVFICKDSFRWDKTKIAEEFMTHHLWFSGNFCGEQITTEFHGVFHGVPLSILLFSP
jgi:hypothetical protein